MQRQKVTRELLSYVSSTLSLDCSELSELRTGAALVQLAHSLHPASFDLARTTLRPTSAFQREKNFKLLQEALEKAGVDHEFSIRDVLDEKKPELYHLLVWACAHHRATVAAAAAAAAEDDGGGGGGDAAYDAVAERQKVVALHGRRRAAAALRRSGAVGVGDDGGGSDLSGSIGSSCISGRSSSTNYLSSYNKSRAARFPVADRGRRPGAVGSVGSGGGGGGGSAGGGVGGGGVVGGGSHYHAHTKASASKAQFLRSNSADVRLPAAVSAACVAGAAAPTEAVAAAAAATQQTMCVGARPPCPQQQQQQQQQASAFPKTPPIPSVSTLTSSCGGLTESSTHTGTPSASAPVSPGCRAATEAPLPAAAEAASAEAAQGGMLLTLASQIAGVVAAAVTGGDDDDDNTGGAAADRAAAEEPAEATTPAGADAVSPSPLPLPQQQPHTPCEATTPVPACTPLTASNTTLCTISPMTTPEKRECVGVNAAGHDAAAAAAGRSPARTLHMDPTSGRLGHVVLVPGLPGTTAASPSATLAAAAAAAAAVAGSSASLAKGAVAGVAAAHRGVAGGVGGGRQKAPAGGSATPSYRQRRKAPPSCALPRGSGHAGSSQGGGGRASLRRTAGGGDFMPGDFVQMKDKLPVGFNFIDPSTWSGETECPIAQVARWNEQQSLGECLDKLAGPARLSPSVYVHAQSNPHTPATSISHSIQSPAQSLFPTGLPLTNAEGGVSIVGGLVCLVCQD